MKKGQSQFHQRHPRRFGQSKRKLQHGAVFVGVGKGKTSSNPMWKVATCALAFVLIAVLVVGSVGLYGEYASAATVSLDVNPSIEIKLNNKQKVVSVTPLNTDGEIILGTMDLRGSNLDVVINALIGSMLRNGYLSDLSNSVLVSVDSSKSVYDSIVQKVTDEITVMLSDNRFPHPCLRNGFSPTMP